MQIDQNLSFVRNLSIALISAFAIGCQYLQPKQKEQEKSVARVGDNMLTEANLIELTPVNLSKADSIIFAEKFVTDWVKKQLMIKKAKEIIDFNEAQIQNKVLNYQYALMVHELEKRYIEANLDEEVSEEEITDYYAQKSANFVLRQNLAKCLYFKIPQDAPQVWKLRRSLKNYPADTTEIWKYAEQNAVKAFTEDAWVKFEEVLLETPLKEITDKARFLRTNSFIEVSDEDFIYFIKIFEYKLVGEVAPLEFIRESVADVIVNKRKIALKKELEKKIYEEAKQTDAFEIFNN